MNCHKVRGGGKYTKITFIDLRLKCHFNRVSSQKGMGEAAVAIQTMQIEMENLQEELEEQSDEEVEEPDREFNKGLVKDALGIISASADLVSASAALQAEADRKAGFVPGQTKSVYGLDKTQKSTG